MKKVCKSWETRFDEYWRRVPQSVYGRQARCVSEHGYEMKSVKGDWKWSDQSVVVDALVSPGWVTGGVSGGNCWGGKADTPVSAEVEPNWLLDALTDFAPDISLQKYANLLKKVVRFEFVEPEYYGNYYMKAFEVLSKKDFLEVVNA